MQVQFIFSFGIPTEIAFGRKCRETQLSRDAKVAGRKSRWTQLTLEPNVGGRNCRRTEVHQGLWHCSL